MLVIYCSTLNYKTVIKFRSLAAIQVAKNYYETVSECRPSAEIQYDHTASEYGHIVFTFILVSVFSCNV